MLLDYLFYHKYYKRKNLQSDIDLEIIGSQYLMCLYQTGCVFYLFFSWIFINFIKHFFVFSHYFLLVLKALLSLTSDNLKIFFSFPLTYTMFLCLCISSYTCCLFGMVCLQRPLTELLNMFILRMVGTSNLLIVSV